MASLARCSSRCRWALNASSASRLRRTRLYRKTTRWLCPAASGEEDDVTAAPPPTRPPAAAPPLQFSQIMSGFMYATVAPKYSKVLFRRRRHGGGRKKGHAPRVEHPWVGTRSHRRRPCFGARVLCGCAASCGHLCHVVRQAPRVVSPGRRLDPALHLHLFERAVMQRPRAAARRVVRRHEPEQHEEEGRGDRPGGRLGGGGGRGGAAVTGRLSRGGLSGSQEGEEDGGGARESGDDVPLTRLLQHLRGLAWEV